MTGFNKMFQDEDGQGMVEYALIIGAIAVTAIVVLLALGPKITNKFKTVNNNL